MNQPPYNPQAQAPYPPGNVGFEQYQQGAPPPYNANPEPYPKQQYGPPNPGPYGHGAPGPYGTGQQYPAGQHPQTIYVYEDRRRQKQADDDTCLAMLAGACAMCLCCSLLSD